jgi:putative flippase GtrA
MTDFSNCGQEEIPASTPFSPPTELAVAIPTLNERENLAALVDRLAGPTVPVRFLLFAKAIATIVAMTGNFLLNNHFTYWDQRLHGRRALVMGLLSFYAVCGLGAAANVGIASHLFDAKHSWWLAGLGGAAIGAVWNYAMSSVFVWRSRATAAPAQITSAEQSPAGRSALSPSAA